MRFSDDADIESSFWIPILTLKMLCIVSEQLDAISSRLNGCGLDRNEAPLPEAGRGEPETI